MDKYLCQYTVDKLKEVSDTLEIETNASWDKQKYITNILKRVKDEEILLSLFEDNNPETDVINIDDLKRLPSVSKLKPFRLQWKRGQPPVEKLSRKPA